MAHEGWKFTLGGKLPKRLPAQGDMSTPWWEQSPDDAASSITQAIDFLARNQRWRIEQFFKWVKQYGNMAIFGYPGFSTNQASALRTQFGDQLTYNLTGSVIDTLVSKIARNKPQPYFLSDGGDYKAQRLAKNRNRFINGVFYENDSYKLMRLAFRDACVGGDGVIKVVPGENGRVLHERVLSSELFVDEFEALVSTPRTIHQVKFVDRRKLMKLFPDSAAQIKDASWRIQDGWLLRNSISDLVGVRESWHLRSTSDAKDGKHIITIGDHALTPMEEYKHDTFPFAFMSYSPKVFGFWSQGLAEQLQNIQFEINKICWFIQRTIHLGGTFKWWVKSGTGKVAIEQLSNQIATIIRSEEPPQTLLPGLVQPELYAYLATQIQRGYQQAGISQMDASSVKPQGLSSGAAIREYHDIGTERFLSTGQAYEEFSCQIAKLSVLAVQDLLDGLDDQREDEKPSYVVRVPNKGSMIDVDFHDLAFRPDEEFYLQCFPVSALPSEPAGRIQKVQEYVQAGWIDADTGRDLIDFPDLGRVEDLHNAQREFIIKMLDGTVDDGTDYVPEPAFDNLPLMQSMAEEYYARGKLNGLPEGKLEKLRELVRACVMATAAALPPPPQGGGAPASPMPPPQSDLIANVNGAPAPQ